VRVRRSAERATLADRVLLIERLKVTAPSAPPLLLPALAGPMLSRRRWRGRTRVMGEVPCAQADAKARARAR
jgi:hypothetical protein